MSETPPDLIVVIGAGLAGLACARELKRRGREVLILESLEAVGGRVKQDTTLLPGMAVELGAEMLHGDTTSVFEIARSQHWERQDLFVWAQGDGGPMPCESNPAAYALYYLGRHKKVLRSDSCDDVGFSLLNSLCDGLCDTLPEDVESDSRTMDQFLHDSGLEEDMLAMAQAGYGNTLGCELSELSYAGACHFERGWVANDGEGDCRLVEGLGGLVQFLLEGIEDCIRTERLVEEVGYSAEQVVVKVKGGESLAAAQVVVTVPLTVLQNGQLRFVPPLPRMKLNALACTGMGNAVKVHLVLSPSEWYDENCHGLICTDCFLPEMWFRPLNGPGLGCIVTAFATGKAASKILQYDEGEIFRRALEQLDDIFGSPSNAAAASSCFLRGRIFDWGSVESIGGGFTFPRPGYTSRTPQDLAGSLDGKVFFAGEHTSREAGMTMHGALDSGLRAAREILGMHG